MCFSINILLDFLKDLTSIENIDVVDNSLSAISFSAPKYDQVLTKLCRRVAVPGGRG